MASADNRLQRLLSELAQAEAPQIIEEARAGARERARKFLEDALLDELLSSVASGAPVAQPARADPAIVNPARADQAPAGPAIDGEGWWLYGVVPAGQASQVAEGLAGIEPGTEVTAVREGDLAGLVSPVALAEYGDEQLRAHLEDIVWLERTARAHESVQEQVMRRAPLVPIRLCTIYRDLDAVRRTLQANAGVFSTGLAALQDCAEWGVKVFREFTGGRPAAAEEPRGRSGSGVDYLAQRQRERELASQADELCSACADEVHQTAAALARQDRVNPVQRPEAHGRQADMILNGAYLVEHSRVDELQSAVAQLCEEWAPSGFLVELTGPWPPYNFVTDLAGVVS